ncbi:MAG: NADH-quinone oxidoreductase subunit M [SAR116 cluster bacterium]|nr:NADH-quinone oxidoreductase subunit M [SAR116 cluster bacterium]|tara:strand:- start:1475 stop:2956 length:1482 start_codon:yes stop_codon:yes gene_type:complete
MISSWPILSITTFLPLCGAFFIILISKETENNNSSFNVKTVALWTSIMTFLASIILLINFDFNYKGFQFEEISDWVPKFGIVYHFGVDGISLPFILLTTFLIPMCILASWNSINHRLREYMISFLVLETFIIGMFCSLDLIVFYIFFEAVLIPMFLIIGIWGGVNRVYAAFKFFLYTLLGSVLMLIAIIYILNIVGSSDLVDVQKFNFSFHVQLFLFLAFMISFAVKVPMWPFHTWLPDAHVEAPTAGSVILAGVLLKMGGYGFLRFSLPLFPEASQFFQPIIFFLSCVAIIYTSLVAFAQTDIKKLIAYSSVAHMGFVTIGIFTFNTQGLDGAVFQMISHGLISGALFLSIGVLYERTHTRDINMFGNYASKMPKFSVFLMIITLGSVGLPGTSGFIGEILVLLAVWSINPLVTIMAGLSLILGAIYMLRFYRKIVFGNETNKNELKVKEINFREYSLFLPLSFLIILFGIFPNIILNFFINPHSFIINSIN